MRISPNTLAQAISKNFPTPGAGTLTEVIKELGTVYEAIKLSDIFKTLKGSFGNIEEKVALLSRITDGFGTSPEASAVLLLLVRRNQFADIPRIIDALRELRAKEFGVDEADIISVKTLTPVQKERAEKIISKISGRKITLHEKLNPAILGGLIIRYHDTLIDASLIRSIIDIKKQLI
jgi:F-type H+-transporting ATPase subunit delta